MWKFLKQLLDPIRSVLQYEIRCVYIIHAQSSIRFQEERQYVNEGQKLEDVYPRATDRRGMEPWAHGSSPALTSIDACRFFAMYGSMRVSFTRVLPSRPYPRGILGRTILLQHLKYQSHRPPFCHFSRVFSQQGLILANFANLARILRIVCP